MACASSLAGVGAQISAVLGAQWGDEGKGKLVDILSAKVDICARFNGGANAGHTLVVEGRKYAFHLLPCGIIHHTCKNFIGNGVVLHIPAFLKELEQLKDTPFEGALARLFICSRASLLFDLHMMIDGLLEERRSHKAIGTTKRGIGPCYSTKMLRNGLRVGDLLHFDDEFVPKFKDLLHWAQASYPESNELKEYPLEAELDRYRGYIDLLKAQIVDGPSWLHGRIAAGDKILAEGANAVLLDIDFGTYPYVTSSSPMAGGICTGLGLAPREVAKGSIIGVVKAYLTRVGNGAFPTECTSPEGGQSIYAAEANNETAEFFPGFLEAQDEIRKGKSMSSRQGQYVGDFMRDLGFEWGTTTGRPRRCGWIDIPLLQYGNILNGYTSINITKLDVLSGMKEVKIGAAYEVNGRTLMPGEIPENNSDLERVTVKYETFPGWSQDITQCTTWGSLPIEARAFVERIEALAGVPVSWVGVGPGREAMFLKA